MWMSLLHIYAGSKQKSSKIMTMQMFAKDKVKWSTENLLGLNFASVRLTTIQVIKLLL